MASNSFGQLFRITTWGESHGPAIGVIIDGCPAGIELTREMLDAALAQRAPGNSPYTSPRKEPDQAEILSGVFNGKTTGAPVSILIQNQDADSSQYELIQDKLRPGHANYTYLAKYGCFDYRGGGRASARETAARVAAGAVAAQLLKQHAIHVLAYLKGIGPLRTKVLALPIMHYQAQVQANPLFCPDPVMAEKMQVWLQGIQAEGDSVGGLVEFVVESVPAGLGDPVYEKLEANLAKAMLSIPASKGFEIGAGFQAACMRGSEHNDAFIAYEGKPIPATNHAGGLLGGITTGAPLIGRVAFKPTSSIRKLQQTTTLQGEATTFELPEKARHDPCVAIRAVPVVQAMCQLVLADALLMTRAAKK